MSTSWCRAPWRATFHPDPVSTCASAEQGVAQDRIRKIAEHRRLDDRHEFTGFRALRQ